METTTYAQYLQEHVGEIPASDCLDVIDRAEKGMLSDFDVQEQLGPVATQLLVDAYLDRPDIFKMMMMLMKEVCSRTSHEGMEEGSNV